MLLIATAATACCGAETMGYRFVAEPNTRTPVLQCPVLVQAPEATPFAAAGDVLHDLTSLARAEKIPLADGWALWNQTRKLLIVRGPLVDQWRIADRFGFDAQSRSVKVTVEWLRAKAPTAMPAEPAFASLGILGSSGMKINAAATLEKPDGRWKFSAEVEPQMMDNDDGVMNIGVTAKWQRPGVGAPQHGTVITSVVAADGRLGSVAAWYAVGRGDAWWLRLKADLLLADGTCWRDARLRQVGDAAQPWPTFTPAAPDGTLPEVRGWQVGGEPMTPDMIKTMVSGSDAGGDVDPFANSGAEGEYPRFGLPEAVIPEALKDLAAPGMLDLRKAFFDSETATRSDAFLAYDPISQRVVSGSNDRVIFEQIESLFASMDDRWSFSRNVAYETWLFDDAAQSAPWMKTALVGGWGKRSVIELGGRNQRPLIRLEWEVTPNENDSLATTYDFRCRMQPQPRTALDWHGNSITHLVSGVPLLTDACKLPDGRTLRQGQRASVIQARTE
jgi:hypothetical protein